MSGRLIRVLALAGMALALARLAGADAEAAAPSRVPGYEYVHPVPGARFVSRFNNVLLRPGHPLVEAALHGFRVSAEGSVSGLHTGRLLLSDDARTVIFEPAEPFAPGEQVTVTVGRLPSAATGAAEPARGEPLAASLARDVDEHGLRNLRFDFTVSPVTEPVPADDPLLAYSLEAEPEADPLAALSPAAALASAGGALDLNTLPSRYPGPTLLQSNHPAPGHLFLSPFTSLASDPGHLLILDEYAKPIFYRQLLRPATDFKPQPQGRLSYFTRATGSNPEPQFYLLDEAARLVDSVRAGNGYETDTHELRLLPNGHALLMAYDPQPVRMDSVTPGGRSHATVIGLVIQELDASRRVVFQWRSWDHFEITDTESPLATLLGMTVDYVHGNAIEVDRDGDLLISSRHLNEITKISRRSGEVLWRMGPNARRNQFEFLDDPRGFSHQHDIRVLPNGHYTLYDNGNYVAPQFSRALEYEIDESARTARLVWEYRRSPVVYGPFMGSVQRLEGGGTLVGWGGVSGTPKVTEIHADGTTAFEIAFPRSSMWTYRAGRAPWRTSRLVVDRTRIDFPPLNLPVQEVPVVVTNPGPEPLTLNYFVTAGSSSFSIPWTQEVPLSAGQSVSIPIRFTPGYGTTFEGKAYLGAVTTTDVIVQDLVLTGAPAGGRATTAPARLDASRAAGGGEGTEPLALEVSNGAIRFALPGPGRVLLELFDVRGARVRTLDDGVRAAGVHELEWPREALPNGLYFARLTAGSRTLVRKVAGVR